MATESSFGDVAQKVAEKILEHMDLPSTAPRPMSARGPPVSDQSDIFAQQFFEE